METYLKAPRTVQFAGYPVNTILGLLVGHYSGENDKQKYLVFW